MERAGILNLAPLPLVMPVDLRHFWAASRLIGRVEARKIRKGRADIASQRRRAEGLLMAMRFFPSGRCASGIEWCGYSQHGRFAIALDPAPDGVRWQVGDAYGRTWGSLVAAVHGVDAAAGDTIAAIMLDRVRAVIDDPDAAATEALRPWGSEASAGSNLSTGLLGYRDGVPVIRARAKANQRGPRRIEFACPWCHSPHGVVWHSYLFAQAGGLVSLPWRGQEHPYAEIHLEPIDQIGGCG